MDYRGVLLVGVVVGAGVLASSAACSGPDPGAITFAERPGSAPPEQSSGSSSSSSSSSGTASSTGGTTSSGGADSGGPGDPVFGNTAFKWQDPGVAANNAAAEHAGTVEGKDCITAGCHLDGANRWAFGGTVYSQAAQGQTVAKAEIRIIKPDGTEYGHAYTDANGNFWLANAADIPAGSIVGVRKEGGRPMRMATKVGPADRGCSANRANCHGTAGTGRVYAP